MENTLTREINWTKQGHDYFDSDTAIGPQENHRFWLKAILRLNSTASSGYYHLFDRGTRYCKKGHPVGRLSLDAAKSLVQEILEQEDQAERQLRGGGITDDRTPDALERETDAAYDRACTCLPEIEAARQLQLDARMYQEEPSFVPAQQESEQATAADFNIPEIREVIGNAGLAVHHACGDPTCNEPGHVELVDIRENVGEPDRIEILQTEIEQQRRGESSDNEGFDDQSSLSGEEAMPSAEKKKEGTSSKTKHEPKPICVQASVNRLVWQHGANVRNQAIYPELLLREGLDADEVTEAVYQKAVDIGRQRLKEGDEPLEWTGPVETETASGVAHVWTTACGKFKITRVNGAEPRYVVVIKLVEDSARERILENNLSNLDKALRAVESYWGGIIKATTVKSNRKQVLEEAEKWGLHKRATLAPVVLTSSENGETPKQPKQKKQELTEEETVKAANELDKMLANERKQRQPKQTSGETDRFGTRLGTDQAAINACLSNKPKSVKDLVSESGVTVKMFQDKEPQLGAFYTHLKKLAAAGLVKKVDGGYVLV